ncbi:hypothetical protein AQUCO_02000195v1 [Aquilegia coerulea]|uniref:Btz domain-containing protein n=1 Tax=Aquilegia coerulea TaxID=218851 RepID=A0A2G5DGD8_AQUCA|nr:hypothetical protein AQUCO_02000195v1 [Aquilegia coerulea]
MKVSIKEEEGNVEDESDSEEEMLPWKIRRKEASSGDDDDGDGDERNHLVSFHCKVSDSELEGQGGCSDYFTASDEEEEEFLEVGGFRVEERDYCSQDDDLEMELRKQSWYEEVMNNAQGKDNHTKNQVDEKKEEICSVPKSGPFYMHDDRFQGFEDQQRYPSQGPKLWQAKVDQKWEHDRFEEMDSKHTHNRKENKNSKRDYRGGRSRVTDHGCSGESRSRAVSTQTNQDAGGETLNNSSGKVFSRDSYAKSNLITDRIFDHALRMVTPAPRFYPSRSTCQTKDVCAGNTNGSGYHSDMTERNFLSSHSIEETKLLLRKQSRDEEVSGAECTELPNKTQLDEKEEETISPVPKSVSFYMHDNRFEGQRRYPSQGQKSRKVKVHQKWEHDKFEAIDSQHIRNGKENKISQSHYRACSSRVMDDGYLGKSRSRAYAARRNQRHTPRTMRGRGPKSFAKNNYRTVPMETNQDAGEVTLNSSSRKVSTQNSSAKSDICTHKMSSAAPHPSRMSSAAPPFYPSTSTSQDIPVAQTRDVWVGNTNSIGYHSVIPERNSWSSHSTELFRQNTSDKTNDQNVHNLHNMQFESPGSSPINMQSWAPQKSSTILATSVFLPVTQYGGYPCSDDERPAIGIMPPGCLSQTELGSVEINWCFW